MKIAQEYKNVNIISRPGEIYVGCTFTGCTLENPDKATFENCILKRCVINVTGDIHVIECHVTACSINGQIRRGFISGSAIMYSTFATSIIDMHVARSMLYMCNFRLATAEKLTIHRSALFETTPPDQAEMLEVISGPHE